MYSCKYIKLLKKHIIAYNFRANLFIYFNKNAATLINSLIKHMKTYKIIILV